MNSDTLSSTCGRGCERRHSVVWSDADGVSHVRRCGAEPAAPGDLASELRQLYPRRWGEARPELWPLAEGFNQPLRRRDAGSALGQRVRRGERVALARQLTTVAPNVGPGAP